MKAVTFQDIRSVRSDEVAEPRLIDPRDAIVRVRLAAICGSDMHVYHGRETGLDRGTILGHEFVGEVLEVGADAGVPIGARVASPFTTCCGACHFCRIELPARCEHGALFGWVQDGRGLHGAQAELVRVPLADATPCPMELELPARVAVEGVAAEVSHSGGKYSIPGAALLRAKVGEGAWLVRCPRLGGLDPHALPARALPEKAELWIVGPSNATVYVDGKEVGTTPLRVKVTTGFREVGVEKLSSGGKRATRWVPVFGDTKVRMPRPHE